MRASLLASKMEQHQALVDGWIARYEVIEREGDEASDAEAAYWTYEQFDKLCRYEPEVAWLLILQVLKQTNNKFVLENLAAGPLETLLATHGPDFIDRVEALAKTNLDFRWLLAGVWENTIAVPVWNRIQQSIATGKNS